MENNQPFQPMPQPAPVPQPAPSQYTLQPLQAKRHFGGIGLALFLFMMLPNVVGGIAGAVAGFVSPGLISNGNFMMLLSYAAMYLVGFPVFLLVVRKVPDTTPNALPAQPRRLGFVHLLALAAVSIGITYLVAWATELVNQLIQLITGSAMYNPLDAMISSMNPWITLLIVGIVAPIMEEIVFRGVMYKKLIGFGDKTYIFFSAFLFSMIHANLFQMIYAFALGAIFAAVVIRTGSIKYTIILHMVVNWIGGCIQPLLSAYTPEWVLGVFGIAVIVLAAAGLIIGVVWLARNARRYYFAPGGLLIPGKKTMFINAGMLLFIIFIALNILLNLLTPLLMSSLQELTRTMEQMLAEMT